MAESAKNILLEKLEKEYNEYRQNLQELYPGNKITNDIYCKLISLVQNDNIYLQSPKEQKDRIKKIIEDYFSKEDDIPKLLKLYPDELQYNQMKDLEFRNSPEKVKEDLIDFFIQKYFRLNNKREKILTKSNQILNFKDFNEKFQVNKDYKIGKINTEIEFTIKRLIRLLNCEENRKKDFEYYLKHFKVKRIDSIFLKKEQSPMHHNLRKDDFEVYFRELTYRSKVTLHLKSFSPFITYAPIKSGFEIWKNSKTFLNTLFRKAYENQIKNIKSIYSSEKQRCNPNDLKVFKEYFKSKYQFYYKMKIEFENEKTTYNFTYDIYHPPLIISINSEIRPYLKELCEYFLIPFDLSIDKGKAFSYSIDVFYPKYFSQQSKNFQFNSYELTFNEIASGEIKQEKKSDIEVETKTTEILRNKYNIKDGFLVNGDNKFLNDTLKHTSFKSEVYIKSALWTTCICVFPDVDIRYQSQMRTLNEVGYVDSNFKYILEIIEKVDLSTLNRLIEDYTMNTSTRIRNTIKLISSRKEENEYSQLRELVSEIIQKDDIEKGIKTKSSNTHSILNPHDEYTEKVDGDLLKYLMTLRFLKLRDYKFFILNLLNYFRYIQKRIAIDTYKIENRNWKKNDDLNYWTDQLSNTLPQTSAKPKYLIVNQPLSEFSKTNPIIPSLERILESKKNEEEFNRSYFEEIDEIVEYSDKLIRIKDNKGNYIIYEATLSDMKQLEDEFCKIGTYYIQKKEKLIVDTDKVPNPFIDRTQVILDLFLNEFDFLYAKFEFISEMMTIYENTTDIFVQKKLMKQITNVMASRPILDLDYHYFTASYVIEIELLRKKAAFMHILIDYQKKMEMNENRQLYDAIDKYYWLLGETALEVIQHVRLDKTDIETLKQVIEIKKQNENEMTQKEKDSIAELEEFISLFTRLKQEKELENDLNLQLELNRNKNDESVNSSEKILKFDNDDESAQSEEEKGKSMSSALNSSSKSGAVEKKSKEELNQKLTILLRYLKKLFSIALTGGDDNFLDSNTESLIKSQDEILESIKSSLSQSLSEQDSSKKRKYQANNRSYSISNTSLDLLNYQIRSLLNIPNPFLETKYMNYIEKNPMVVSSLNKEINFTKFEEGYPHKFLEQEDSSMKSNEIEFFESLSEIISVFNLITNAREHFYESFVFENEISRHGLEISIFDYLIEEWENFKDCITGKKSSAEFEKLYYLQNTIIDNYHSFSYTVKNLSATLSNPINKIPPQLLASLPNPIVEKNDFENTKFIKMSSPKDPTLVENLMLDDLEKSLMEILTQDFKTGWVKFKNHFDELTIYCNTVELYKMKQLIFSLIVKNTLLSIIYEKQKQTFLNTNEGMLYCKESIGMIPPEDDDPKSENYVDRYYSMQKEKTSENQIPQFSIEEFDPSLTTCIYFKDMLSVQIDMLDKGLNELKTFASYAYMNFFLLLIATQHNNLLFFEPEKYMSELNLFKDEKIVVKNSLFNAKSVINTLDTNKTEKAILHEMTKQIEDIKQKLAKEFFYSIIEKKNKNRNNTLNRYNTFIESKIKFLKKPTVIKHVCARHERLLLCNAYIKDITFEVFLDSIRLQACKFSTSLRKIVKTIPKEYNIFEINEFNFIENEKYIGDLITPYKNFYYFHDRGKVFNKFYIPSDIEILHLKNQNENDILYHYSKYNPMSFSEEVLNPKFFSQFKELFYQEPTICNTIENSRNKFFNEAYSYQSNALLYLQFCSFFINFLNLKYIEICLTQKPMDIVQIIEKVYNGDDFWGDKKTSVNNFDESKRLPLNIVEKIVDTQKNYLNLRINFDRFKNDLEEVIKNLKKYLEDPERVVNYMNMFMSYKIYHWYHILNIAREICLKKNDISSFAYLSKIIRENFLYGKTDYFNQVECKFQCHIDSCSKSYTRELFYKHMHFEDNTIMLNKLQQYSFYNDDLNHPLINSYDLMFMNDIKVYFPFISENKIAEVRNLNFKISSMTKNYLIYIEKSELNSDLIDLDAKRIEFLKYYIKLTEFKYKFIILLKNKLIPLVPSSFKAIEKYIKQNHSKIDCEWIENSSTSDPNEPEILSSEDHLLKVANKKTSVIFNQIATNENIFDNKRENNLKMKNTIIVEAFINGATTIFSAFCNEVDYIMINKAIDNLSKENNAMKELFASARNDLDINKFKNKFSSNFLKELDATQIGTINRKFPFFENFINQVKNVSIEVETHSDTNAILISKVELEDAIKTMIRDFIVFDTNITRSNHFSYSSEKFGYYFSIKKLEIWLKAYKTKLTQFDQDLEKISNAKTALTNNTLVYEMDNLYRQLKVLKDNIKIMELYIRDYFEDKFNGLILSFRTEMAQIEAKFHEFRNNLVITTNQKITEEYSKCITELKNKTTFITEQVNKISYVDTTEEKEFFDTFYRGLQMNQNYHNELNNERKAIEGLQDDIAKLHGYYRMKLHNQKVDFEKELDELRKNLSNNKDLWDKLAIAERNEVILKEELAKTQKSLASAEEFIKRLRIQIRNSHDKNVSLEKQISQITVKDIINNAGKGVNVKAMELYSDIRQSYVYNMKNNVNIITALERIKTKYEKDEDIKVVLANFEMLHQKYAQEVDNKRTFSITLQNIKDDIERMQSIHTKKLEEITKVNQQLRNENSNLKIEIEKMRYNNPLTNSSKINRKVNKSGSSSNNQSHRSSTDKFPEITTNRRSMNLDNKDKSNKSIKSLV